MIALRSLDSPLPMNSNDNDFAAPVGGSVLSFAGLPLVLLVRSLEQAPKRMNITNSQTEFQFWKFAVQSTRGQLQKPIYIPLGLSRLSGNIGNAADRTENMNNAAD